MEDDVQRAAIADKVRNLDDLELASLLGLIAGEHCIIRAEEERLKETAEDLEHACTNTFGLSCAVVNCTADTTLDEFGAALLIDDDDRADERKFSETTTRLSADEHSFFRLSESTRKSRGARNSYGFGEYAPPVSKGIADVIIAMNLHLSGNQVQIQALELIRSKRMFTRKEFHQVPKRFLILALLPTDVDARLVPQLNDHIFISHVASDPEPDLPPDQASQLRWASPIEDDAASTISALRSPSIRPGITSRRSRASIRPSLGGPFLGKNDLDALISMTAKVRLSPEIRAYIHNCIIFMRMHRAVAAGVSAMATRHLLTLSHALAPLHNLTYITPSLVDLAVRKIYPHRLMLTLPEDERSMQWGSSITAVADLLEGITVEEVIEDVLLSVETPL